MIAGEFGGIGAILSSHPNGVIVEKLIPLMPAEKAGLSVGDIVISVDGISVLNESIAQTTNRVRGQKGTPVHMMVVQGKSKPKEYVITRDTIALPSMASRVVTNAKLAVINTAKSAATEAGKVASAVQNAVTKPSQTIQNVAAAAAALITPKPENSAFVVSMSVFTNHAMEEFVQKLKEFKDSNADTMFIDLRNNPGGEIDTAVSMASHFIAKDQLVVKEYVGKNRDVRDHLSLGYGTLASTTKHIYVLVNAQSASASEIFAGALQDYKLATIVGQKTYGKGSVQQLVELGDVGTLKITIARWYTPLGRTINGTGITPDVIVPDDLTKYATSSDPFFDAAIDMITEKQTTENTDTNTATSSETR
jgi:carboxyl-terminal processing protease